MEQDIDPLLMHYEFPQAHWDALRTTNPIERVNNELKRRSKSMEVVSAEGLKGLLAFTAMRLEYSWQATPITSRKSKNLPIGRQPKPPLEYEIIFSLTDCAWGIGYPQHFKTNHNSSRSIYTPASSLRKAALDKAAKALEAVCSPTCSPTPPRSQTGGVCLRRGG